MTHEEDIAKAKSLESKYEIHETDTLKDLIDSNHECWSCGTAIPVGKKYCQIHCGHPADEFNDFTGKCESCDKSLNINMMMTMAEAKEKGETYHFMWNHKQVRSQLLTQAGLSDENSNKEWNEIPEEDQNVLKLVMNDLFYSNDYNTEAKASEAPHTIAEPDSTPQGDNYPTYYYEMSTYPYSCKKCGETLGSHYSYIQSMIDHLTEDHGITELSVEQTWNESKASEEETIDCQVCKNPNAPKMDRVDGMCKDCIGKVLGESKASERDLYEKHGLLTSQADILDQWLEGSDSPTNPKVSDLPYSILAQLQRLQDSNYEVDGDQNFDLDSTITSYIKDKSFESKASEYEDVWGDTEELRHEHELSRSGDAMEDSNYFVCDRCGKNWTSQQAINDFGEASYGELASEAGSWDSWRCHNCGEIIPKGQAGKHRDETGHRDISKFKEGDPNDFITYESKANENRLYSSDELVKLWKEFKADPELDEDDWMDFAEYHGVDTGQAFSFEDNPVAFESDDVIMYDSKDDVGGVGWWWDFELPIDEMKHKQVSDTLGLDWNTAWGYLTKEEQSKLSSYRLSGESQTDEDIDWTRDKPEGDIPFYCPLCGFTVEEIATYDGVFQHNKQLHDMSDENAEILAKGFTYSNSPPTSFESKIKEVEGYDGGLVDGITRAESGEMDDEELREFVLKYQDTLMQLQGSWQRTVQSVLSNESRFTESDIKSPKYGYGSSQGHTIFNINDDGVTKIPEERIERSKDLTDWKMIHDEAKASEGQLMNINQDGWEFSVIDHGYGGSDKGEYTTNDNVLEVAIFTPTGKSETKGWMSEEDIEGLKSTFVLDPAVAFRTIGGEWESDWQKGGEALGEFGHSSINWDDLSYIYAQWDSEADLQRNANTMDDWLSFAQSKGHPIGSGSEALELWIERNPYGSGSEAMRFDKDGNRIKNENPEFKVPEHDDTALSINDGSQASEYISNPILEIDYQVVVNGVNAWQGQCNYCGYHTAQFEYEDAENGVVDHVKNNHSKNPWTHGGESKSNEYRSNNGGRYLIAGSGFEVDDQTDDLELAKAIANDASAEEITTTPDFEYPQGALKGSVTDMDTGDRIYTAESNEKDFTFGDYEVKCDCDKDPDCKTCGGKGTNTWSSTVYGGDESKASENYYVYGNMKLKANKDTSYYFNWDREDTRAECRLCGEKMDKFNYNVYDHLQTHYQHEGAWKMWNSASGESMASEDYTDFFSWEEIRVDGSSGLNKICNKCGKVFYIENEEGMKSHIIEHSITESKASEDFTDEETEFMMELEGGKFGDHTDQDWNPAYSGWSSGTISSDDDTRFDDYLKSLPVNSVPEWLMKGQLKNSIESKANEDSESQQRGLSDSEEEELIEQTLEEWKIRHLPYMSVGQDVSYNAFKIFAQSKNLTQSEIDYLWTNGANPELTSESKASEVGTWADIETLEGSLTLRERNMWIEEHFNELSSEDFTRLADSARED
jgi:hypothetical protein